MLLWFDSKALRLALLHVDATTRATFLWYCLNPLDCEQCTFTQIWFVQTRFVWDCAILPSGQARRYLHVRLHTNTKLEPRLLKRRRARLQKFDSWIFSRALRISEWVYWLHIFNYADESAPLFEFICSNAIKCATKIKFKKSQIMFRGKSLNLVFRIHQIEDFFATF